MKNASVVAQIMWKSSGMPEYFNPNCFYYRTQRTEIMHTVTLFSDKPRHNFVLKISRVITGA